MAVDETPLSRLERLLQSSLRLVQIGEVNSLAWQMDIEFTLRNLTDAAEEFLDDLKNIEKPNDDIS